MSACMAGMARRIRCSPTYIQQSHGHVLYSSGDSQSVNRHIRFECLESNKMQFLGEERSTLCLKKHGIDILLSGSKQKLKAYLDEIAIDIGIPYSDRVVVPTHSYCYLTYNAMLHSNH